MRPRNPGRSPFIPGADRLDRDYSLTEKQDFEVNIRPYIKEGYVVEPIGIHRYGYFVLTGWKISQDVYGAK